MKSSFLKLPQPIKFGIIGLINTGLDFGLFFSLTSLVGLPIIAANIISTSAALLLSYSLNAALTFQVKMTRRRTILFFVVTISGLWLLQPAVIHFTLHVLNVVQTDDYYELFLLTAKVAATVASLVWNYLLYKYVVFRPEKEVIK